MFADARGCSDWRTETASNEIQPGELGTGVAGWRDDVCVYVFARGASSGSDSDAGPSTGVSDSSTGVGTYLAVELVVEAGGARDAAEIGYEQWFLSLLRTRMNHRVCDPSPVHLSSLCFDKCFAQDDKFSGPLHEARLRLRWGTKASAPRVAFRFRGLLA